MRHRFPIQSRAGAGVILALALILTGLGARCAAHPATIAAATAKVQPDGHFEVQARFDTLAFVLDDTPMRIGDGPMNDLLDGPASALQAQLAEAAGRFGRDFKVLGGDAPGTVDSVSFPSLADVQQWRDSGIKPRLPVMIPVTVRGHLPPGATSVSFRFPDVLGMIVVTTEFPYREPTSEPVEAGAFSTPLPLTVPPPATPPASPAPKPPPAAPPPPHPVRPRQTLSAVPVKPPAQAARPSARPPVAKTIPPPAPARTVFAGPAPQPVEADAPATPAAAPPRPRPVKAAVAAPITTPALRPAPAAGRPLPAPVRTSPPPLPRIVVILRYVKMGCEHILPEGLDHILFVIGLFLLSPRTKALLWQITAFTVAHSLTLGLSLYGIVRLPPSIVEPMIAASITFVAIENIFTTELKPWRPVVVFGFGLVHGMGFAGALKDLGLQRHDFLTALVGFNAGVELGQLSVVALAMLTLGWFRSRPGYRRLVVVPASVAIAAVAAFWTFQRLF